MTTTKDKEEDNDNPNFIRVSEGGGGGVVRHESLLPTFASFQRHQSRSLTFGYPGVREEDIVSGTTRSTFQTNLQKELQNVKHTFHETVKEAQQIGTKEIDGTTTNNDFLLEMTLTRTLSIMPNKNDMKDVTDGFLKMQKTVSMMFIGDGTGTTTGTEVEEPKVVDGRKGIQKDDHERRADMDDTAIMSSSSIESSLSTTTTTTSTEGTPLLKKTTKMKTKPNKQRKIPISAYIGLLIAVTALSSIGPFLSRLDGVSPPLRIVWRQHGTALVLWPFALRSCVVDGPPQLSVVQWMTFVIASFSYCVLTVAFSISVDYTTINDAAILTNSQSLLLVFAKIVLGSKVVLWEWLGVLIAFTGAFMCSRDSVDAVVVVTDTESSNPWRSLVGDGLALLSAFGGLGYIMLGKSLRDHVEVYVFMTINMVLGSSMILIYMKLSGDIFTFDNDSNHGIWGWANFYDINRFPVELAVVFICNIMGTMGYVRAFKYFSSVIIAVAALLEPVTATLLAIVLQVGIFPGVLGCIGNILVILGTLAVIYPSAIEEEEEDVTDDDTEKDKDDKEKGQDVENTTIQK